jgi:REP-associated tyrosine transposase
VVRDDRWSEAIAVGSLGFLEIVKAEVGIKALHRDVTEANGSYALREAAGAYGTKFRGENEALSTQNTFFWNETVDAART